LSKGLVAELALERPLASVFPKVIPEVARLLERTPTVWKITAEVELYSMGFWILNSIGLMPLFWDSLKLLLDPLVPKELFHLLVEGLGPLFRAFQKTLEAHGMF